MMNYIVRSCCQKQGIHVPTFKLGSRTAWDEPNDRRHPNCCCPLPQSWGLTEHWTKKAWWFIYGHIPVYSFNLGGRLKQGSGVTSQGCASHPGVLPVYQKPAFSFFGSQRGSIFCLSSICSATIRQYQALSQKIKRPSSRWRAQRALDAVQHVGTETGTRRSHQGIGIGTRPATQRTEIGGKRAVMPTRTVDSADLPLHGARHIMMEMVQTSTSKRTRRTETAIVIVTATAARVRRIIRRNGSQVVIDGHAARADPLLARAHVLGPDLETGPDNALEHATQSGAQVEIGH